MLACLCTGLASIVHILNLTQGVDKLTRWHLYSYCVSMAKNEVSLVGRVCNLPWRAAAAELLRRAGGRTLLVRTVATVILVVTHPLRGDAAPPGTGELRVQAGGRGRGAGHALTPPRAALAEASQRRSYFIDHLKDTPL